MNRPTQCSEHLAENLDELKRKRELESLRAHLIEQNCFPGNKDPHVATITIEELKKLGRIWKIQERRNLMKSNDINDYVFALLQHIDNSKNYGTQIMKMNKPSAMSPLPPSEMKPSSPRSYKMKNYCGIVDLFRQEDAEEMALKSRVYKYPDQAAPIMKLISTWRTDDMKMKDFDQASDNRRKSISMKVVQKTVDAANTFSDTIMSRNQIMKHRNLAAHLVNYSTSNDIDNSSFTHKSIQTFISLANTDDTRVASHCLTAISNISSFPMARHILVELNSITKLTSLQQMAKSSCSNMTSALLFYYFSCDSEVEDRIYNASSSLLQSNVQSDEHEIKNIALLTLNNLLPCIDRPRVVEILFGVFQTILLQNQPSRDVTLTYLKILQNICAFSNTHIPLFSLDVVEILNHISTIAISNNDAEIASFVCRILQSLLHSLDNVSPYVSSDFVNILIDSVKIRDLSVIRPVIKCLSMLSGVKVLVNQVCDSDVVTVVTSIVDKTPNLPADIAKDAARYLANISQPTSKEYLSRLVLDGVPIVILQLLRNYSKVDVTIQQTAVRGLQNILSNRSSASDIAEICIQPLLKIMKDHSDIGAILCIFNIACVSQDESLFSKQRIHIKILELLCSTQQKEAKSAYLHVLVQLSSNAICISELLAEGLVSKLEQQILSQGDSIDWRDLSKLLLAVSAFKQDLLESDRYGITKILRIISSNTEDEHVIGQCATVIAFLSLFLDDFNEVDYVLRDIVRISTSELVMEAVSTILFNISCSASQLPMLLKDNWYFVTMIKLMRSGLLTVQRNVAQTMRNMCVDPRCIDMLLSTDALSDLIVIALLRTSSIDIKEECGDAFYNMLCHSHSRAKLLKGDLWWAVSRLSRTESDKIRSMCIKILFELSCDYSLTVSLRENHILSFIRDILTSDSQEFLQQCLKSTVNLISNFKQPLVSHEIIALIRISCILISRFSTMESLVQILPLLLICVNQQCEDTDVELVSQDICSVLERSSRLWKQSMYCREIIACFLWQASKSERFNKSVPLTDLLPIWSSICEDFTSPKVVEYILSTILGYYVRDQLPANALVSSKLWGWILSDAFGLPRSGSNRKKLIVYNREGQLVEDADQAEILPVSSLSIAIAVMAGMVDELLINSSCISSSLIDLLVSPNLINSSSSQNLLYLLLKMTKSVSLSAMLIKSRFFIELRKYLKSRAKRPEQAVSYCATVLFNLSLHSSLIHEFISRPESEIALLITDILDAGTSETILHDISVVFYFASCYMLKSDFALTPVFALNTLNAISERTNDSTTTYIGKYVIGVILDKYSTGISIEPIFIQSMFTEILQNSMASIPGRMSSLEWKEGSILPLIDVKLTNEIQTFHPTIDPFSPDAKRWVPIIDSSRKRMNNVLVNIANQEPEVFARLFPADVPSIPLYSKIVVSYPRIGLDQEGLNDLMTIEEVGPEDDDDASSRGSTSSSHHKPSSKRSSRHSSRKLGSTAPL